MINNEGIKKREKKDGKIKEEEQVFFKINYFIDVNLLHLKYL